MKATRVLITAALGFLVGGSAVAFATPAAASTRKAQCANINCAYNPELGVYCSFTPGQFCSMSSPNRCEGDNCS